MSADDLHAETDGRLPAATAVWEQLKPICLLAGLLLGGILLVTLDLVVRL
jgi:hypothetical protein